MRIAKDKALAKFNVLVILETFFKLANVSAPLRVIPGFDKLTAGASYRGHMSGASFSCIVLIPRDYIYNSTKVIFSSSYKKFVKFKSLHNH